MDPKSKPETKKESEPATVSVLELAASPIPESAHTTWSLPDPDVEEWLINLENMEPVPHPTHHQTFHQFCLGGLSYPYQFPDFSPLLVSIFSMAPPLISDPVAMLGSSSPGSSIFLALPLSSQPPALPWSLDPLASPQPSSLVVSSCPFIHLASLGSQASQTQPWPTFPPTRESCPSHSAGSGLVN
ncbi:hypothetical protein ROHU_016733 [Labeo rohita]|uniref:Uncharacterized protein n=1 Tax=Labeo rohita TaxID=84645 RepID=A0A498NIC9_LABRO|nr:hypothetical protein ROHU_033051 [Labeo rohita]RXN31616.1 hypothetical protein ROHU_016733 [Labeo rohita]